MKIKISILLFLLLWIFKPVKATHIVGGDFSLRYLSGNTYELTLKVLRDCENGVPWFNDPVYVGMFDKSTNRLVRNFLIDRNNSNDTLVFTDKGCIRIPTGCTHMATYKTNITLDPSQLNSTQGYYFSWERCCRNTIIKNIIVGNFPGITGMTYYMETPPFALKNSSPIFSKDPLTLLCVENPFRFNYGCTDVDGDSLVYSLVTPLQGTTNDKAPNDPDQNQGYPMLNPGPYLPAKWSFGYSLERNIMDASPVLEINPVTGELFVMPRRQGVYAISIRVEEYRNGQKIGEVRRELQLTVSSCSQNPNPIINNEANNKTYTINAGDSLCFPITISDISGDSLYAAFSGDMLAGGSKAIPPYPSISEVIRAKGRIDTRFCWKTTCAHNKTTADTFKFTIYARDNGCPINKIVESTVTIVVNPMPIPDPPYILCLDRIDSNTLKLNIGGIKMTPSLKGYYFVKVFPDKSEKLIKFFTKDSIPNFYIDNEAYNHRTNHYKYYFYGENICGLLGRKSYEVNSDPSIPDAPAQPQMYRATVISPNKGIRLEWKPAKEENLSEYIIYRKKNEPNEPFIEWKKITNRLDTILVDSTIDVNTASYCYQIEAHNYCGYFSQISDKSCSILLKGVSVPFEHQLSYTPYLDWKQGVEYYQIERKNPNSETFYKLGQRDKNTLEYNDDKLDKDYGANYYRVEANEQSGNGMVSYSNEIFLFQKPLLYPPNAFTPNFDGLNDSFNTSPIFVKDYHLQIYTRWGELIFETSDKNKHWDGTYKGSDSHISCFIWQVYYSGWDKSEHRKTGYINIIK